MSNTALASVPELRERIRQLQAPTLDTRSLPTHPVIGRLLPGGALKEGATYSVNVIVVRPPRGASDSSVARLSARLRKRGATLLVLGTWPNSEAMLSITESAWTGIGNGHGHLQARDATITVTSKTGGRPRSARIRLSDNYGDTGVRSA